MPLVHFNALADLIIFLLHKNNSKYIKTIEFKVTLTDDFKIDFLIFKLFLQCHFSFAFV